MASTAHPESKDRSTDRNGPHPLLPYLPPHLPDYLAGTLYTVDTNAQSTGTFELLYSKSKKEHPTRRGKDTLNDADRFETRGGDKSLSEDYDGSASGSGTGSYSMSSRAGGPAPTSGGGTMELINEVEEDRTASKAAVEAKTGDISDDAAQSTKIRKKSLREQKLQQWAGMTASKAELETEPALSAESKPKPEPRDEGKLDEVNTRTSARLRYLAGMTSEADGGRVHQKDRSEEEAVDDEGASPLEKEKGLALSSFQKKLVSKALTKEIRQTSGNLRKWAGMTVSNDEDE